MKQSRTCRDIPLPQTAYTQLLLTLPLVLRYQILCPVPFLEDTAEKIRRRQWQPTPVLLPGESQGRGAWWAAVYGVAQSRTRLKRLSSRRENWFGSEMLPLLTWGFNFYTVKSANLLGFWNFESCLEKALFSHLHSKL